MVLAYRRLLHALDNHGFAGLLRRALKRLAGRRIEPTQLAPVATDALSHPFDQAHATDTSGYIPGERLAADVPAGFYNTAYYAISPSTLSRALCCLPAPPDGFTFVDLGCGKGRALLVAAQFPFRQILGVELAPDLCRIAAANTQSDPRICIYNQDATTFRLPEAPLVLYLYHPFLAPLLRRLLRNLQSQLDRAPRELYLLYANPTYPKVMASFPLLREVWDFSFPFSPEDAAADRHGSTHERYTLYRAEF